MAASQIDLSKPGMGPIQTILTAYANMLSVGSVYALSALQAELPRLFDITQRISYTPFGAASLGLSFGVFTAALLTKRLGASGASAAGTSLWGVSLCGVGFGIVSHDFWTLLLAVTVGGIGVGWTYLAVIIMVGEGLPKSPLVRSAIGPLGFSSGTAVCIAVASKFHFNAISAEALGAIVIRGGAFSTTIGALTGASAWLRPRDKLLSPTTQDSSAFVGRGGLVVLLYINALPGMMVFSALIPGLSHAVVGGPREMLAFYMVFLGLGGILAPTLVSRLGTTSTFAFLFIARALLLAANVWRLNTLLASFLLAMILVAHGAGFSIMPALIKAQLRRGNDFPHAYGQVLVAWGAAGITSALINAARA